ncbi:hypothetical protein FS749_015570 [Ceratobasidium sp. UAMH 11750]|nr:hypothetical protein FS749_015570 [Ceratobasidium sp. UAMH 11750]
MTTKHRPTHVRDGSGIVPPALPHERPRFKRMTTEEKERFKWERHNESSSSDDQPMVTHAFGGRHIARAKTDVKDVWFAAAHTNVGGDSVKNGERYSLAHISLRWMVRQRFKCNTGTHHVPHQHAQTYWPPTQNSLAQSPPIRSLDELPSIPQTPTLASRNSDLPAYSALPSNTNDPAFNADHPGYKYAAAPDPNNPCNPNAQKYMPYSAITDREHTQLSRRVDSYEPYLPFTRFGHETRDYGLESHELREPFISEEVEDLKHALSPIYDQLTVNWWWWILEIIPVKQVWRKKGRSWRRFFVINLSGPQVIKNQKRNGVNVHRTVQLRMSACKDLDGKPFSCSPRAWLKLVWVQWLGGAEGWTRIDNKKICPCYEFLAHDHVYSILAL